MPRCCEAHPNDFEPCYASVLVAGLNLRSRVEDMERLGPLCPCVTVWCNTCKKVSTTVSERALFSHPSAYFAHALVARESFEAVFRNVSIQ